ncbi:hypothetical protein BC567DRAFT_231590 [Phyllosticta citribraziliensis]
MYVCMSVCLYLGIGALCCATGAGSCPAGRTDGRTDGTTSPDACMSGCCLALVMALARTRAHHVYIHLSTSTTTYIHVAGQPSFSLSG